MSVAIWRPPVRERSRALDTVVVGAVLVIWCTLYTSALWSGLRSGLRRVLWPTHAR